MKKKILALILLAVSLLTFCSCGEEMKTPTASEILNKVMENAQFDELIELNANNVDKRYYGADMDKVEDFKVFVCSNGAVCDEVAIFKMKSKKDVNDMLDVIKERKQELYDSFVEYVPEESVKINNAVLSSKGQYVYFVVSNNHTGVKAAIESCF